MYMLCVHVHRHPHVCTAIQTSEWMHVGSRLLITQFPVFCSFWHLSPASASLSQQCLSGQPGVAGGRRVRKEGIWRPYGWVQQEHVCEDRCKIGYMIFYDKCPTAASGFKGASYRYFKKELVVLFLWNPIWTLSSSRTTTFSTPADIPTNVFYQPCTDHFKNTGNKQFQRVVTQTSIGLVFTSHSTHTRVLKDLIV